MPKTVGALKLYDVGELSDLLKISKETVRLYCRTGRLPARKLGLNWHVSESGLTAYFDVPGKSRKR
jgi:hypothetical protein